MRRLALVVSTIALLALVPLSAAASETSDMAAGCRVTLQMQEKGTAGLTAVQIMRGGACAGYFRGLFAGLLFADFEDADRVSSVKIPVESDTNQLIRVFLKYTDDHPEHLHRDLITVVLLALSEAFPGTKGRAVVRQ